MSDAGGNEVPDSTARYLPFGDWRVEPAHDLTDQGFTGQKHNMDLGLYYYNARFYLPGIGRFATADTIVPDPMNPQQYNRYTYTLNNPLRYTDQTGHCTTVYEPGSDDMSTCISGWNAIMNILTDNIYGAGGSGIWSDEVAAWTNELLQHATIEQLETLMHAYGIDYGYESQVVANMNARRTQRSAHNPRGRGHIYRQACQYWQPCWEQQHLTVFTETQVGPWARQTIQGVAQRHVEPPALVACVIFCMAGESKSFSNNDQLAQVNQVGWGFGMAGALGDELRGGVYILMIGYQTEVNGHISSGSGMVFELSVPFIGHYRMASALNLEAGQ